MEINRHKLWIILVLFSICLFGSEKAIGQQNPKWRIKNRFQASYEFDNNIREAAIDSLNSIEDSSLRFLFNSRALRVSPKSRIIFSYRGGLQTYFHNSIENKLINEFDISTGFKIQKLVLGIRGSGKLKIYLNDVSDYVTGSFEGFLQLPPILNINNEIAVNVSGLNYQSFSRFNYSESQIKWSISKNLFSRVTGMLEFSGTRVKYNRTVNFMPEDPNFALKQKDSNYKFFAQLKYSKSFLLNFNYMHQHNRSNTKGYAYSKHQLTLMFGVPLLRGIWLRSYTAFQLKNYSEKIIQIFPLDIDTERDESNFFIFDISKDINSNLNALLRFAYYNNESIVRNRFYSKSLVTVGFDYRF